MKKLKRMIVRMTEEEHQKVRKEAFERNVSMSRLVKQALKIFFESYNSEEQ